MTLERGWKTRQEAALKRAALREKMHEINRARASVIGCQVNAETIVPVEATAPAPAPVSVAAPIVDEDQFDPAVDVAPEPAPAPKGRRKT